MFVFEYGNSFSVQLYIKNEILSDSDITKHGPQMGIYGYLPYPSNIHLLKGETKYETSSKLTIETPE